LPTSSSICPFASRTKSVLGLPERNLGHKRKGVQPLSSAPTNGHDIVMTPGASCPCESRPGRIGFRPARDPSLPNISSRRIYRSCAVAWSCACSSIRLAHHVVND
jgi:hypothetical protein